MFLVIIILFICNKEKLHFNYIACEIEIIKNEVGCSFDSIFWKSRKSMRKYPLLYFRIVRDQHLCNV